METEIRLVLLVIGALVILAILWDGLRRQRRAHQPVKKPVQEQQREVLREALALEPEEESVVEVEVESSVKRAAAKAECLSELEHVSKAAEQPAKHQWHEETGEEDSSTASDEALWQSTTTLPPQTAQQPEHPAITPEPVEQQIASQPAVSEPVVHEPVEEVKEVVEPPLSPSPAVAPVPASKSVVDELVIFTIVAPDDKSLGGFNLLQALLNNGFRFGEGNIFHYHLHNDPNAEKLFSLAAASETGEFELSNMANFTCKGVVVFMNSGEHEMPDEVFTEMVEVTERLAKALNAELRIGQTAVWDEAALQTIHDRLAKE